MAGFPFGSAQFADWLNLALDNTLAPGQLQQ
jgi:hypothetical protein